MSEGRTPHEWVVVDFTWELSEVHDVTAIVLMSRAEPLTLTAFVVTGKLKDVPHQYEGFPVVAKRIEELRKYQQN